MKKKLFCLLSLFSFVAFGCVAFLSASVQPVHAEDVAPSIVVSSMEHGSVSIVDEKESYEVGEIVSLDVKPATLYLLDSLSVNDVAITKSEEGEYAFAVVSGENLIKASFKVDEALLGEFANAYAAAQNGDWKSVFTVQNLLIFISFLINSGIAFALVKVFTKYKKSGSVDRKELIKAVNDAVPSETKKIIGDILKESLLPLLTELSAHMDDVTQMCQKFIQAFLYSLEDTMDSKEKIISLLSGLNLSDQNSIDEMKTWFTTEVDRIEKKTEEYKKLVADMKASNEKALKETKMILPEESKEEKELKEEETYDGTSI